MKRHDNNYINVNSKLFKIVSQYNYDLDKTDFKQYYKLFPKTQFKINKEDNLRHFILEEACSSTMIEGNIISREKYEQNQESIRNKTELNNFEKLIKRIKKEQLNNHLLRTIHQIYCNNCLDNDSHNDKPGKFKNQQNYLSNGYIPCSSKKLINELEKFYVFFNQKPKSIQIAYFNIGILHAWFERIHPFEDGNGQVGRFLINYYLWIHQYVDQPVVNFSSAIKNSQANYINQLLKIDIITNYVLWIEYWLKIVTETLEKNLLYWIKYDKNH